MKNAKTLVRVHTHTHTHTSRFIKLKKEINKEYKIVLRAVYINGF